MKFIMPLLVLIVTSLSMTSKASDLTSNSHFRPCEFADYQFINKVLKESLIIQGNELKKELASVLTQEMGPKCSKNLVEPEIGLPGSKYSEYLIESATQVYQLNIEESMEAASTFVTINLNN